MREVLEFAAREGLVLMADEVLGLPQVPGQFIDTAYCIRGWPVRACAPARSPAPAAPTVTTIAGFSFCSLTAAGRGVPCRKKRCGQGIRKRVQTEGNKKCKENVTAAKRSENTSFARLGNVSKVRS